MGRAENFIPDLFGQVSVSDDDVRIWLEVVARMEADSPRRASYVRMWNVYGKIAAAKARGEWPPERF